MSEAPRARSKVTTQKSEKHKDVFSSIMVLRKPKSELRTCQGRRTAQTHKLSNGSSEWQLPSNVGKPEQNDLHKDWRQASLTCDWLQSHSDWIGVICPQFTWLPEDTGNPLWKNKQTKNPNSIILTVIIFHIQCETLNKKFQPYLQIRLRGKKNLEKIDNTNKTTDEPDIETGIVKHGD